MGFSTLALIVAAGLLGPILAGPARLHVPVIFGELVAGILLGTTGLRVLHPSQPTFAFLADIGFALVMFVAGSHVPVRDERLRRSLGRGTTRALCVGGVAVAFAWLLAHAFGIDHVAAYAVVLASSSAAVVLPLLDEARIAGTDTLDLLAQVAVADTACIVALPLAIEPARAGTAAIGALLVLLAAGLAYVALRAAEESGWRRRVHHVSERRKFALELRVSLLVLFAVAALAHSRQVSVMLAGFGLGVAVQAVGEPRRLARQLFALTDGFFSPLFFVWIGATLDLRAFGSHPKFLLLGVALGAAAVAAHAATRLIGQPVPYGVMSSAQLGVPIAAVTLAAQQHAMPPGEPAALLLGAILTIVATTGAAMLLGRRVTPPEQTAPPAAEAAAPVK